MALQTRTQPLRAATACAIGCAVSIALDDLVLFAICSIALAFVIHELRQTILFNRDAEKLRGRDSDECD